MPGPISYDPTGPCVLIKEYDDGGSFLFHIEILAKAGHAMHDTVDHWLDVDYRGDEQTLRTYREIGDERPEEFYIVDMPRKVLGAFKRWAYHGDLNGCGIQKLEDVRTALQQNENEFGASGFQDALVDKAIEILTKSSCPGERELDRLDVNVLAGWDSWPYEFRVFLIDWVILRDPTQEQLDSVFQLIEEKDFEDGFTKLLTLRTLHHKSQQRSGDDMPWKADPCQYHAHPKGRDCYKVAGAIDIWRGRN